MTSQLNHQQRIATAAVLWVFLFILAGTVLVGGMRSHAGLGQLWTLATTHQPERYLQLYFENPGHLPSFAPAGKPQVVYAHFVNHEARPKVYQYMITRTIGGVTKAAFGSISLNDGQEGRVALRFTIPKPQVAAQLTLTVLGSSQQLSLRSRS